MRTSKEHFERFKTAFKRWQEKLGVTGYRIDFIHYKLPADNTYADIACDGNYFTAEVRLNTRLCKSCARSFDPEMLGQHEAIHLFLFQLSQHAKCDTLGVEESMVHTLQRIL